MTAGTNNQPSPLGEKELLAIEMKFDGFNYKEIATKIDASYGVVRQWFMTGGKLRAFYDAYVEEESKARRKTADDIFKAHLNTAVRTLVDVMTRSKLDIARIAAAKEIINRQLGEPLKVIASDNGKVTEYLEAIRLANAETISTDGSQRANSDTLKSS